MSDRGTDPAGWAAAGVAGAALAMEAALVIGLRSARIAQGGQAGRREATLMVSEKIATMIEVQTAVASGRYGSDALGMTRAVLAVYAREVRANRRRLTPR